MCRITAQPQTMEWQRLISVYSNGSSFKSTDESRFLHPILGSVFFYGTVVLLVFVARKFLRSVEQFRPILEYLEDALSAIQVCACTLENSCVRKHYGYIGYVLATVLLTIEKRKTFGSSKGNPMSTFETWTYTRFPLRKLVLRFVFQCVFGLYGFHLARMLWMFGFRPEHIEKLHSGPCQTDLNVPVITGAIIEGSAALVDTLTWTFCLISFSGMLDLTVKAGISCAIIMIGIPYTGLYTSPAMATSSTYGCSGVPFINHVTVYWVAPLIGCYIAVRYIAPLIKNFDQTSLPMWTTYINYIRSSILSDKKGG